MELHKPPEHGDRCTCRMLAAAVGCNPKTLTYNYCRTIAAKTLVCGVQSDCCNEQKTVAPHDAWHDLGPIDPIKAILIINE